MREATNMAADLELVDQETFRAMLGMSKTTFWRHQHAGDLPPHAARIGRKTLWKATTISKWLESKPAIK